MSGAAPLERVIEALLFLSPEPVTIEQLVEATDAGEAAVERALDLLAGALEGRGVVLRRVAGGYALAAHPDAEEAARRLLGAVVYRTTPLFERLFGLEGLDALPDPARFDPSPEDERDLRERLLKAGEARAE